MIFASYFLQNMIHMIQVHFDSNNIITQMVKNWT